MQGSNGHRLGSNSETAGATGLRSARGDCRPGVTEVRLHEPSNPPPIGTPPSRRAAGSLTPASPRDHFGVEVDAWLAAELHDTVCQHVAALALLAGALERRLSAAGLTEAAAAHEIATEARRAGDHVRAIAAGRMADAPEPQLLLPAVLGFLAEMRRIHGVHLSARVRPLKGVSSPKVALHLYRILQEAVTNAIRHGQATRVCIRLRRLSDQRLKLTVRDNGCGTTKGAAAEGAAGLGLRIMRIRAEDAGGRMTLRALRTGGCIVSAVVRDEGRPVGAPTDTVACDGIVGSEVH